MGPAPMRHHASPGPPTPSAWPSSWQAAAADRPRPRAAQGQRQRRRRRLAGLPYAW